MSAFSSYDCKFDFPPHHRNCYCRPRCASILVVSWKYISVLPPFLVAHAQRIENPSLFTLEVGASSDEAKSLSSEITEQEEFAWSSVILPHLYKECENENLLGRFRFANPYEVSHNPKTDSSKKADALAKRLIGTSKNQFVLVPCNVGWHWILTVIDPHSETVYVLDSLNNKTHVEEWKSVVEMAMKVFNMSTHGKRTRKNMIWNVIKCPQQPDGKQCGFYVMRFMKDIIENCGSPASMSITLSFDEGYYSKKK